MKKRETYHHWVMHGAGNSFILLDDRSNSLSINNTEEIVSLCSEEPTVDGLILIESSQQEDFFMRFYNPDGHEADMCGNGARCVARLAYDLGIAPNEMSFETQAGCVQATVEEYGVTIRLPNPTNLQQNIRLENLNLQCDSIHTGVPHAVIFTDNLQEYPLSEVGPSVRHHPLFGPEGTNVNVAILQENKCLAVRTYERGVEGETPACGTGITAVALIAYLHYQLPPPISLVCAHGDTLRVFFKEKDGAFSDVRLYGPAEYISRPRKN